MMSGRRQNQVQQQANPDDEKEKKLVQEIKRLINDPDKGFRILSMKYCDQLESGEMELSNYDELMNYL